MKKIVLIALMVFPLITYAATCEPIVSTLNTNSRDITCDDSKSTVTSFKTTSSVEVLKNDICTITCDEEIVFSVDPVKRVLAGTGFNYPLYASGKRTCTAEYKYTEYETKMRRLVSEYESLTGTAKETKRREIVNYYELRKECDNFTSTDDSNTHKYKFTGNVQLSLSTSEKTEIIPYKFVELDYYSNVVENDEINVTPKACDYDEVTRKCRLSDTTVKSWVETANLNGKYTMNDTYLKLYTGEIVPRYNVDTCNAGDKYFTSFNEFTKPVSTDDTDKGYALVLTATNLGNNLKNTGKTWALNVTCSYKVKNLSFPTSIPGGQTDENYPKYGGTAFQYRIIDLDNPFPNRLPSANWDGINSAGKTFVDAYITSTKNNLTTMQRFVISLDASKINRIRSYNKEHSYDTFNLEQMEKSTFIIQNEDIIDRK